MRLVCRRKRKCHGRCAEPFPRRKSSLLCQWKDLWFNTHIAVNTSCIRRHCFVLLQCWKRKHFWLMSSPMWTKIGSCRPQLSSVCWGMRAHITWHICWEAFTGKSRKKPIGADVCSFSSSWEGRMDLKGCIFRAIAHELCSCHFSRKQMWDIGPVAVGFQHSRTTCCSVAYSSASQKNMTLTSQSLW